jgi:TRAP-type C4-dicarboxylate transport system permease large subunit
MFGAAPFVVTLLVMVVLLILIPDIALWLPTLLGR